MHRMDVARGPNVYLHSTGSQLWWGLERTKEPTSYCVTSRCTYLNANNCVYILVIVSKLNLTVLQHDIANCSMCTVIEMSVYGYNSNSHLAICGTLLNEEEKENG